MKKLSEIPKASIECNELPGDEDSEEFKLIKRLENEGHQVIACGRGFITIERCEDESESPNEINGWGTLKISIYSDPDVTGEYKPINLYMNCSRYAASTTIIEQVSNNEGKERIFKHIKELLRSDF